MKSAILVLSITACAGSRDPISSVGDVASIRVFDEGTGVEGRIAIFQDRNGEIRKQVRTGSDGIATSSIRPGDMVTLANVGAPKFDLTTYVDLQPSDVGIVGETETEDKPKFWADLVRVSLPEPPPGAMRGHVGAGLALTPQEGAATAVRLIEGDNGASYVVGVATDASGAPVAFTTLETSSGTKAVALPAWRTDWHRVDVRLPNLAPSAVTKVSVEAISGDARFPALAAPGPAITMLIPSGIGRAMDTQIVIDDGGARRSWRRVSALANEVTLDAADLLPPVTQVAITRGVRPTVTWSTRSVDAAAVVVIRLSWGEGDAHRWTVIAPAAIRSFQFPALPDELALWRPGVEVRVGVGLLQSSELAGYHAVMRHGIEELDVEDGATLRTSTYGDLELP